MNSLEQIEIKKLSGLSNACYRVALKDEIELSDPNVPRTLLYRKFECEVVDKQIEAAIFRGMSDAGLGPKLIYHEPTYRIE